MATAYAIPNVADDDETSDESTLVGSLKAEDTLVGDLPKVNDDDEDATSDETTLVNDTPSIAPKAKAKARSSEIRELRPTPSARGGAPRPVPTKKPARTEAKPSLVKPPPKVEAKKKAEIPKIIPQPVVQPVTPSEPPPPPPPTALPARGPVLGSFDTAPYLSIVKPAPPGELLPSSPPPPPAPVVAEAEVDLADEAMTLELTMSPVARVGHVLLASVLFVWYAIRGMAAWFASYARPYWQKASADAARRVRR